MENKYIESMLKYSWKCIECFSFAEAIASKFLNWSYRKDCFSNEK